MRCVTAVVAALCLIVSSFASAATCPGNPDAIGTSRTLVVDPREHARIGDMQYPETLPLRHKEVVLTFDDGPLPKYTGSVLETLASECAQATFFIVGRMARAYPEWVRKLHEAGHTIGTHSHTHPRIFPRLTQASAIEEIDDGIRAAQAALSDPADLAPFFRFPGFGRTPDAERHLIERGIMIWGADVPADDWKPISSAEVVARAIRRLEEKGRGVLLLHDIKSGTAAALPSLFRELKARGFKIVHVVPARPDRPKTATEAVAWRVQKSRGSIWPDVFPPIATDAVAALPVPSAMSFGFPALFTRRIQVASADHSVPVAELDQPAWGSLWEPAPKRRVTKWPALAQASEPLPASPIAAALPVASMQALSQPFGGRLIPAKISAVQDRRAELELGLRGPMAADRKPSSSGADAPKASAPRREAHAEPPRSGLSRLFQWFH
jgi:peptidoglycan-N-acetylglucosamine deacetylase